MKTLFGRVWRVPAAAFILLIFLAIWIDTTKDTNCIAGWVFNTLDEWAVTVGPAVTLVLAATAIWAVLENRRSRAKDRQIESNNDSLREVRKWVEGALRALSHSPEESRMVLAANLRPVTATSIVAVAEAKKLVRDLANANDKSGINLSQGASYFVETAATLLNDLLFALDGPPSEVETLEKQAGDSLQAVITAASNLKSHLDAQVQYRP